MPPSPRPVLSLQLFELAARRLGMNFELLDACGLLAEIRRGSRSCLAHASHLPLNDALAARLANDKHYTALLLERAGIRTPETVRCLSPDIPSEDAFGLQAGPRAALLLAERAGFPLMVKPNSLWGGRLVRCVADQKELEQALQAVWRWDPIAVAQPFVQGQDYRLDFLDGEYLAGYQRHPLFIKGDGCSSIRELARRQDARFGEDEFWQRARRFPEWAQSLTSQGWTEQTVLPDGKCLDLGSGILNLNRFALAEALFELPPPWLELGRNVAEILGLRHFGIDVKAAGLGSEAVILEVNAAPALVQLYRMGHREEVIQACMKLLRTVFESPKLAGSQAKAQSRNGQKGKTL